MMGVETVSRCKLQGLAPSELRGKILEFEQIMASRPDARFGNQPDCPLTHRFAGNLYIREILIPKGTLISGRIHRHEHPIFIVKGDVSFVEESLGSRRLKAYFSGVSPAGTKRLVYTHADTVIVTVHEVGEERDLEKIEDMLTAWTYDSYEKGLLPCHS